MRVFVNVKKLKKIELLAMIFLAPVIILNLSLFSMELNSQEQKVLKYEVNITGKTIPLFAVNTKGDPVYNLKENEITLFVNGNLVPFEFIKYQFDGHKKKVEKLKTRLDRRIIFIILDSMFNSHEGFRKSKEIVKEFVQKQYKGNSFVLIENRANGGLHYLIGPEKDEEKIITALNMLKWYPEKKRKQLFIKPMDDFKALQISFFMDVTYSNPSTSRFGGGDPDWYKKKLRSENKRFYQKTKVFGEALSQFKYVLNTINKPKLIFLISEGFSKKKGMTSSKRKYKIKSMKKKDIYKEFSHYYLNKISEDINSAGSVLYTINPQMTDPETDNEMVDGGSLSMKYAAQYSGGKYFEGQDVEKILKKIGKYTAAYYELGFSLTSDMGIKQNIKIKCKRKGVTIHTVRKLERSKPYKVMKKIEKKLFAYNTVFGGTWNNIAGNVQKAVYKVEQSKNKNKIINIDIPPKIQNRKVDLFKLQFNSKTQKLNIKMKSIQVKEKKQIKFNTNKNEKIFFVIIDPQNTFCIFGDGKSNDKAENINFYSRNTSTSMVTAAGKIYINSAEDGGDSISLNGKIIYNPGNGQLVFKKLFKTSNGSVVLLKESDIYRFIILGRNGKYMITSPYNQNARVNIVNGKIVIAGQKAMFLSTGSTSLLDRSFYVFFDRFKSDEEFQRSQIIFPFKRMRFNQKTGEHISTEEVSNETWEFTMFEDSPEYSWSTPEISNKEAIIKLKGEGIDLSIVFKRINNEWKLIHSKQMMNSTELKD